MVSLEQRHDLDMIIKADPDLHRIQRLLNGESLVDDSVTRAGIHENLLLAISKKDGKKFNEVGNEIGKRRIGSDCDWCHDDFLIFLLLLGNEMFGRLVSYLPRVIDARRHTPNSLPQKINEVFAALYRQEFGVDGELAFLKVPFLQVTGHLKIGVNNAEKVLDALSDSYTWNQFSPFLRLLTQKAYDLVLSSRMPQVAETSEELIEGFKKHASNLTLRQWGNMALSLPGKLVLSLVGAICGLGLVVVLLGFGKGLADKEYNAKRERPRSVFIKNASITPSNLPVEIIALGEVLKNVAAPSGNRSVNIALTCESFSVPTPSFVVEVSHPDKTIKNVVAFIQNSDVGERPYTIIPVQKDERRYRIVLPELGAGAQLVVFLNIEIDPSEVVDSLKSRFVLRSLQ